ncbi:MAG: hypothetical protein NT003_00985 [Candidatus Magasanikbacteria bacterium]|nr:hypothetical protein [Candidatus Magasanikbacteria bacterium]
MFGGILTLAGIIILLSTPMNQPMFERHGDESELCVTERGQGDILLGGGMGTLFVYFITRKRKEGESTDEPEEKLVQPKVDEKPVDSVSFYTRIGCAFFIAGVGFVSVVPTVEAFPGFAMMALGFGLVFGSVIRKFREEKKEKVKVIPPK